MTDEVRGDGRNNRRKRSRERIIEAAFLLVQRGNWRPSVKEIAAQAGVSVRTVFDIFGSLDDVYEELMQKHGREINNNLCYLPWSVVSYIIFIGRLPAAAEQQGEPV